MNNEKPGQRPGPDQRRGKPGPSGRGARKGRGPRPSAPVWPTLRRLLGYMKPHAGVLAGVAVVLLATTEAERKEALDKLLPFQQSDFEGLFRAMDGLPVWHHEGSPRWPTL